MKKLILALLLLPSLAWSQGAVREQGPVTTGHVPIWTQDRIIGDSGIAASALLPTTGVIPTGDGLQLYVSKINAVDTGNCQVQLTPCLTINYAIQQGLGYDLKGGYLQINIGAGTFAESVAVNGQLRGNAKKGCCTHSTVILIGAGSLNTTISGDASVCGVIVPSWGADIWVRQLKITATALACQSALFAEYNGVVQIYNDVDFGTASQHHLHAEEYGDIEVWEGYKISSGAVAHWGVSQMGIVNYNPPSGAITLTGTPAFSYFGQLQNGGQVHLGEFNTFVGSATGRRFILSGGANLNTYAASPQLIPGNAPGLVYGNDNVVYPEARLVPLLSIANSCGSGGLGTGCAVNAGGTSKVGIVNMTAGTGAAALGSFTLNLGYGIEGDFGTVTYCTANPVTYNTGLWNSGALVLTAVPTPDADPPTISFNWSNGGTNLTNGLIYTFIFRCGS
jgi:hypothetical protein